jgi:hypothetical protein
MKKGKKKLPKFFKKDIIAGIKNKEAVMEEVKKLLNSIKAKSGKTDAKLIEELKIARRTYYNIKGGQTNPRSILFLEKLHKLAKKYGAEN